MKIIIDKNIPFIKGALEEVAEVIYLPGNAIGPEDIKDADALIIRTRTKCNEALLENSSVRFIATATIGYDHIDTAYCNKKGISWTNAPGCNSSSVEQYIVSALLNLAKLHGFKPSEKTIGIIGVGNVGKKVTLACRALGFKVLCNDPPRERLEGDKQFSSLDEILVQSDIITMHVPLTHEGIDRTLEMADSHFFSSMKDGACFINSSRGEVVSEKDLKRAVKSGKIASAVLDVFHHEPAIDMELAKLLTIATPHIAGYSVDGKANGSAMSVLAASKFFGLGLDSWEPSELPGPESAELFADGSEEDEVEVIKAVYDSCYDINRDHQELMMNPDKFESLRGNYRIRREPAAFHIRLYNDDGKYRKIFEALGFSVIGDSCF